MRPIALASVPKTYCRYEVALPPFLVRMKAPRDKLSVSAGIGRDARFRGNAGRIGH
jgi:hypothetical protein